MDRDISDELTKIRYPCRGEQNSSGADVTCKTIECRAFAETGNGEREVQLETLCSSLFHHGISD
jgi:hypothetical protein